MFNRNSLFTRIAIGKGVGFIIGLTGFVTMPLFLPDAEWLLRWGILFWYTTMGAIIGVFGVVTWHPILRLPMPWWFRAPLIGGWMNFVLTLFIYDNMQRMMIEMMGENGIISSPFWSIAEGIIVGLIIGYAATRFGGEGRDIVDI
ncbi:MAG: hypothetical protein GY727_01025 [Gammaproteobacteria bacterium]|nr:hypothetical protein [Gammaproteobacteria bacterium]MCP4089794.1 hypothetical protein [Gammaproteobacteria bacterium]MCP4278189.1 hypothetical protein [Gammaproteobacteria bacterium]MCP4831908.1 hypothetical protein [Gammaproteobacteria bacterium]MCP4927620.1 hypothetical protein [Gammaproteobacteria bacterium]